MVIKVIKKIVIKIIKEIVIKIIIVRDNKR